MAGKQVICWTDDNGYKGDPFSAGEHYVMAVGYNARGKIAVANSGNRGPVNLVTLNVLCKYLQEGNGKDKKWWQTVAASAGIVVVGSEPKQQATTKQSATKTSQSASASASTAKTAATTTQSTTTTTPPKVIAHDLDELTYGSTGQQVKVLQKLLGNLDVDGIWGPQTNAVVLGFQKRFGLDADGIVGPLTWSKLLV
jgi:hypothetical protein